MKLSEFESVVVPALTKAYEGDAVGLKKALVNLTRGEGSTPITDEDGNPVEVDEINLIGASVERMDDPEEDDEPEERALSESITKTINDTIAAAFKAQPVQRPRQGRIAPQSANDRIPAVAKSYKSKVFTGPDADYKAFGFGQLLNFSANGNRKSYEWLRKEGMVTEKALGEGTSGAGGVLVPPEVSSDIIRLVEQYGVFRQHANVQPMNSDTLTVPRVVSEGAASWIGENSSITEADDTFDNVMLVAKKLARLTRISSELMEDASISMGDRTAQSMAQKFAEAEDDAGFNGTGAASYGGIHGLTEKIKDGNHTAGLYVAPSASDTFGELDLDDFHSVMSKLPNYARANAKWYVSQAGFNLSMASLAHAVGGVTRMETETGLALSFLGHPVVISQKLFSAATALDDEVPILFGDLSMSSTLGDRRSITIATSTDRYFDTDQVAIRGICRVDIVNHDLGDTSTAGPIVGLQFTT